MHPLLKVREEFRLIFFEMGYAGPYYPLAFALFSPPVLTSFAEMPTSSYVESSFWCFDTLFVPQQHPARDLQDTFYLSGAQPFDEVFRCTLLISLAYNP